MKTNCCLYVPVPPYVESDTEEYHEVFRGETVTLVCPVLGSPKPNYVWQHTNSTAQLNWFVSLLIKVSSSSLELSDLMRKTLFLQEQGKS